MKNWVQRKWGYEMGNVPIEEILERLIDLEGKYNDLLLDVKRLEEENVETTNELYRLENSLDARIDILAEHYRISPDV
jgi:hypothetical protein